MRIFPVCLLAATMSAPAYGASLRPISTLEGASVRLSDLFDDAGPVGTRVLGSAPAPGTRITIEAPQLAAIARQFGVEWRPGSPGDHVVLERPGRLLPRDEVMAALRQALIGVGAPDDSDIELPGFVAPLVAAEGHAQSTIDQLDYDAGTGRFTAQLAVTAETMATLRMRLSGTVLEMAELPVPVRRLAAGSLVQPGDLKLARVRSGAAKGEVLRNAADAAGLALRHQAQPGQPIPMAELARPPAVLKGARVTMLLQSPGLTLLAQGQALEAGGIGDHIQVLNPSSRAIVDAEIVAADRVRVSPGSTPTLQAGARPAQYSAATGTYVR
jgi:flagella basal body P-ring formation protein FlgA